MDDRERGIAQMRRSAQLLRNEKIDLIQIHNLVDWRTHLASLRRMKEEGRIRYIGITHYTTGALPELARILADEPGIDFVQLGYSLATRAAETEVLAVAASRGVAVIANQPSAICSAGCASARYRIGRANSTARVGRSCFSNTSSPSLPSPA